MTLRRNSRGVGGILVPLEVVVYGVAKGYTPQELVGAIIQGDTQITITNAEIAAAQWPGPPKIGDKIIMDGREKNIQAVEQKFLGSEILVFVCQVRG